MSENAIKSPVGEPIGPLGGSGVLLQRHGAALLLNLGDGGHGAVSALARELDGRLLALGRDTELYAVVARGDLALKPENERGYDPGAINRRSWELECFSKPLVTLLSGSSSTAALAIALAGTHGVAGDGFICRFDDVQYSRMPPGIVIHALSRLAAGVGAYLMLTGHPLDVAGAFNLGLVTHCIADCHFGAITGELAAADPVDPVLDDRHTSPGASPLQPLLGVVAKHFATGGPGDIIKSLRSETGPHQSWAVTTADQVARVPTGAAKAALLLLSHAKSLDIRQAIILSARAQALLATADAASFDTAAWTEYLAKPAAGDLELASRAELQSLRRRE